MSVHVDETWKARVPRQIEHRNLRRCLGLRTCCNDAAVDNHDRDAGARLVGDAIDLSMRIAGDPDIDGLCCFLGDTVMRRRLGDAAVFASIGLERRRSEAILSIEPETLEIPGQVLRTIPE